MIGQFFTPEMVADCMFRVAGVHSGQRVIDPSCGDGSFLRIAPTALELHGCEIDPQYAAIAKCLVPAIHFSQGDALTSLVGYWGTFDLAIGNPPFSAQTSLERRSEVLQGFDLGAGRASRFTLPFDVMGMDSRNTKALGSMHKGSFSSTRLFKLEQTL